MIELIGLKSNYYMKKKTQKLCHLPVKEVGKNAERIK
jgi:hypothetical protein